MHTVSKTSLIWNAQSNTRVNVVLINAHCSLAHAQITFDVHHR